MVRSVISSWNTGGRPRVVGDVIDAREGRFGGRVFDARAKRRRREGAEAPGDGDGCGRTVSVGERGSGAWCGIQFV